MAIAARRLQAPAGAPQRKAPGSPTPPVPPNRDQENVEIDEAQDEAVAVEGQKDQKNSKNWQAPRQTPAARDTLSPHGDP